MAARAAAILAARARAAVADHGRFTVAVSGGRSPAAMFDRLSEEDVPWPSVSLYQVDERVAPHGHPDRNLTTLEEHLRAPGVDLRPMPVEDDDLEAAAPATPRDCRPGSTSSTSASARTGTRRASCPATPSSTSWTETWP